MSPTIPTYGGPKVASAPLPNARVIADAPQGAFGGPDVSRAVDIVSQRYEHDRQFADQVANNRNELAAAALRDRVLNDPQTGALNLKGVSALGALDGARTQWAKGISEIAESIPDAHQRQVFGLQADRHWLDVQGDIERHTHAEFLAEDARTTNAVASLADDDAVKHADNPAIVAMAIDKKRETWTAYGQRQGWSADAIQAKLTDEVSATHMGVIEHLLNTEQDLAASHYLATHRDEFASKDLLQAERLTDAGSIRAESQRLADTITAKAPTLSKALEEVRQTKDPRVRDALEVRVRREYADRKADLLQERADAFQRASAIVERTSDFGKVPLSMRVMMSPEENGALQRREDQLRHPVRVSSPELVSSLTNAAGLNDATRDWFRKVSLGQYRDQLSDEDFARFSMMQYQSRHEVLRADDSEARREDHIQETAARKAAAAAARRAETIKSLEAMGVHLGPAVPGAPLQRAITVHAPTIPTTGPSGDVDLGAAPRSARRVPPAWADSASRDPEYKKYLQLHNVHIP